MLSHDKYTSQIKPNEISQISSSIGNQRLITLRYLAMSGEYRDGWSTVGYRLWANIHVCSNEVTICTIEKGKSALHQYLYYLVCFHVSLLHFRMQSTAQARCTHTTLCDKVYQWLATGRWFSPGTLVSSTNKTDRHDITEILLKVVLNTITLTSNTNTIEIYFLSLVRHWYDRPNHPRKFL